MKSRLGRAVSMCLALIMMMALLTGCHGSKESSEFQTPEAFDESRDYEITFWAKNDTNKAQTQIYEQAINDFQALYPNIHVTIRLYTDYGRIYNDVITNISTGTTPLRKPICLQRRQRTHRKPLRVQRKPCRAG